MVLKQDSEYYEHFYGDLTAGVHYIPVKHDLSDLIEKIEWAQSHDREARLIGMNGRKYATENLLPKDIFCYHAVLFKVDFSLFIGHVYFQNRIQNEFNCYTYLYRLC